MPVIGDHGADVHTLSSSPTCNVPKIVAVCNPSGQLVATVARDAACAPADSQL